MPNQEIKNLKNVWDKEAKSYSRQADTNPDYLAHFAEVEAAIGKNLSGLRVLDVGTGTGITTAYLASKGAEAYLVDISKKALQFAKAYFAYKNLPVKTFIQDAFKMNFPHESFDVVWNGGVLEHFIDSKKVEMLEKMWLLVKPGGKLIITVPASSDWPFMAAKKLLILRKKWAFGFEDDMDRKRLLSLATKAGIKNPTVYAYNPIVSWWFFPFGREVTNFLKLNNVEFHRIRIPWGHNLVMSATKTSG